MRRSYRSTLRLVTRPSLLACAVVGAVVGVAPAAAQTTALVEVDLVSGGEKRFDGRQLERDRALDAMLASELGGEASAFSTRALDGLVEQIKGEIARNRARSQATRLTLATPGRVSVEKLRRTTKPVVVDLVLVIDSCDRSGCLDAVGQHIELVGRVVEGLSAPMVASSESEEAPPPPADESAPARDLADLAAALSGAPRPPNSSTGTNPGSGAVQIVYRELSIQAVTGFRDQEVEVFKIPIEDCIDAAESRGGGRRWLDRSRGQEERYEPLVSRAIAQRSRRRRIELDGAPMVTRSNGEAQVVLRVTGNRGRVEELVTESMAAAVEGMRQNSATPPMQHIEVQVLERGWKPRRFQAPGPSVAQWLDGRIDVGALWKTYVREVREQEGATTFDFSDDET